MTVVCSNVSSRRTFWAPVACKNVDAYFFITHLTELFACRLLTQESTLHTLASTGSQKKRAPEHRGDGLDTTLLRTDGTAVASPSPTNAGLRGFGWSPSACCGPVCGCRPAWRTTDQLSRARRVVARFTRLVEVAARAQRCGVGGERGDDVHIGRNEAEASGV